MTKLASVTQLPISPEVRAARENRERWDRDASMTATFSPPSRYGPADEYVSTAAVYLCGQVVHVSVQNGVLCVEVGIGPDESGALVLEEGDLVPVWFGVEGETVFGSRGEDEN